ncbi:MAG TPA: ATP-binding protein [Kofleriaceae bacterium]|jgi:hypothetical protein
MDPVENPYAPGAGTPPPELAGRDALIQQVDVALARLQRGNPAKSSMLVGLRGVGKTVLLEKMRANAEAAGFETIRIEASEARSLPSLIAPALRTALLKLSRGERMKALADRALRALTGFARAMKMKFGDLEVALDLEGEAGLADNGDLESDLAMLLEATGRAAKAGGTAVTLFIDELQYIEESQFAALIMALHRVAQLQLPIGVVGAGLPQLRAKAGNAKSYAERLFDYPEVGPLSPAAARLALERPAEKLGVRFDKDAIAEIVIQTRAYPYFLQEWGKAAWDAATASPITKAVVVDAAQIAVAALDESFFRVRFDRLTPAEKRYLRGMAALGPGPHRSGDVAKVLEQKVTSLAPVRSTLIAKGMVWSPSHGDTAFTVPLFDEFMKRIMPDDW